MVPEIRQRKLPIGRQYADDHHRRNGGTRHNTAGEQPAGNCSDWSCSRGRKRTVKTKTMTEQTGLPQNEFDVCGSPFLMQRSRDYQLKFSTTSLLSSIVFRSAVLKIWNENSTVSKFSMLFSSSSVELKTMQSTALFPRTNFAGKISADHKSVYRFVPCLNGHVFYAQLWWNNQKTTRMKCFKCISGLGRNTHTQIWYTLP